MICYMEILYYGAVNGVLVASGDFVLTDCGLIQGEKAHDDLSDTSNSSAHQ